MAIKLSKKDKSLLLFIATLLVILWFIFSFLTNLIFSSDFVKSDASKIVSAYPNEQNRWINIARELTKEDLEDRIILLDFWTHACVNCLHIIPEIKKLEAEFGNKLLVIGVHSGKFKNEKDIASIKKAVLKYDIQHLVVNDSELKIWNKFNINAWPTLVLINPRGKVEKRYIGENDVKYARKDIINMVEKYRYHLNREKAPILLEKNKIVRTVLSYPTKITFSRNFSYKSYEGEAFFIANTGSNNVLVVKPNGEVIVQVGSKTPGLRDGVIDMARFNSPSGLLIDENKLYVADTGNHSLRVVDFKEESVKTLVGIGSRGQILSKEKSGLSFALSSPSDIEFFPNKSTIAIANSGSHQILSYDINSKNISVLAGNGYEGIKDGKYPNNYLAQTSDLSVYGQNLYFLDSETSSLRVLNKNGQVKTLIGRGLFDFGDKNGDRNKALMQHPLGLFVNSRGAYIADSFNHKIRKYNFGTKKLSNLFGSSRGQDLGENMKFDEPDDIYVIDEVMYIVDSNNNRIVKIDYDDMKANILNVIPALHLPKDGFLQYLPNLQKSDLKKIKSENVKVVFNFEKEGWKINEKGPSFLNLLKMVDLKKADLITTFDWNMIKNNEIILPKLKKGVKYVLQGTIYFCDDKENALCYISSHEQEIEVDQENGAENLMINL